MKTCTKCNIEKPKTEFNKKAWSSDGFQPKCRACDKAYKAANAERHLDLQRKYKSANRERIIKRDRDYRVKNAERISRVKKNYNERNPEINAEINRNRSARIRNAEGKHTAADVRRIFDRQRGICANCETKLIKSGRQKFHVDHVMPLALGGSNWPENLQCLCPGCNFRKGSKDPLDWARQQGRLL